MSAPFRRPTLVGRRQFIGGVGLGVATLVGCASGASRLLDGGAPLGDGAALPGAPEIATNLWQMMAPYARASADGTMGTRINLFNSTPVAQRVLVQVFRPSGELAVKHVVSEALLANRSWHIELGELLTEYAVPLPFEGSVWVGTTPESGSILMGLQGIVFDWYDPAHMASVHGLSDFGNSNQDRIWSDLVLPKVVVGDRYVSRLGILNASGDGTSEALLASPEIVIRDDEGIELARRTLDPLPRFASTLLDVGDLLGGARLAAGSIQILEPSAALVVMGYVFDTVNGGINSADHFFDRHFVTDATGFVG